MMKSVVWVVIAFGAGCKGTESAPGEGTAEVKPSATETAPAPAANRPAPPAEVPPAQTKTAYAYKINGAAAHTARTAADRDEPVMSIQLVNGHASAAFYGDIAGSPRRALVTFGIDGFKPEPSTWKARAQFNRYLDKGGGKQTGWHSKKEGATFVITSIVEKEKTPVGIRYLAAGTFEAKGMELDMGQQSDTATIDLTEGTFTDLEVQSIGKAR